MRLVDSPVEWCVLRCALMLGTFMWRLRRQICQYQSLFAQASVALHLLKQNDSSSSEFQSTGPEPHYYSWNDRSSCTLTNKPVLSVFNGVIMVKASFTSVLIKQTCALKQAYFTLLNMTVEVMKSHSNFHPSVKSLNYSCFWKQVWKNLTLRH